MDRIPELAHALREVGTSEAEVEQALESLRAEKRFTVDAAYAYARRREIDPDWRRAADLLELAVAQRSARAYSRPPWWAHLEVLLGVWVLLGVANAVVQFSFAGTEALRHPGTWFWLLLPIFWWYAVSRQDDPLGDLSGGAGRIDQAVVETLRAGRARVRDGADLDAVVAALRRAAGGSSEDALERRMGAAVLARAQRQVVSFPRRHRRTLCGALDRARREQAAVAVSDREGDP